ncbi:MAG: TetR/AcrR family transcriptional regulator [Spirochaetes bacterium]|nr:TetR/AcrR family transcriptional regulator [Spirochaetota bacterium]MBU0956634.1 TetR/AcrR family transcriptional regulator [Spirochaetota bacterium]
MNIDKTGILQSDEASETTREILLRKALQLFASSGYESSGIQELCSIGSVSKPTLYYHFGSKRGLLEAIVRDCGGIYLQAFSLAAHYGHDITVNLQQLLRCSLEAADSQPDFVRLYLTLSMAAAQSEGYQVLAPLRAEIRNSLQNLFALAAMDHGNMRGREALMAELFGSLLDNRMLAAINRKAGDGSKDDIYRIVHQYMHGIFS